MNNQSALTFIEECEFDLERIELIIQALGSTNNAVPYLTKYSIIKVCGTLEQCFKTIISDFCTHNQSPQAVKFIDISFRESSINPNIQNIHKSLSKFDEDWNKEFKRQLKANVNKLRIQDSIKSLNNARNQFAHGGNPTVTFNDVKNYYVDAKIIIEMLDSIII